MILFWWQLNSMWSKCTLAFVHCSCNSYKYKYPLQAESSSSCDCWILSVLFYVIIFRDDRHVWGPNFYLCSVKNYLLCSDFGVILGLLGYFLGVGYFAISFLSLLMQIYWVFPDILEWKWLHFFCRNFSADSNFAEGLWCSWCFSV